MRQSRGDQPSCHTHSPTPDRGPKSGQNLRFHHQIRILPEYCRPAMKCAEESSKAHDRETQGRWLNRTVLGIGLASLFSDWSHEIATTVLPAFLASIGAGAAWLGLIEGVSVELCQDGIRVFHRPAEEKKTHRCLGVCAHDIGNRGHRYRLHCLAGSLRSLSRLARARRADSRPQSSPRGLRGPQ